MNVALFSPRESRKFHTSSQAVDISKISLANSSADGNISATRSVRSVAVKSGGINFIDMTKLTCVGDIDASASLLRVYTNDDATSAS